jgi:hypothetical protein
MNLRILWPPESDCSEKMKKILADVMIGKFVYRQTGNPYQYGGNNIAGTTYVRISNENKIYVRRRFLALSFSGCIQRLAR